MVVVVAVVVVAVAAIIIEVIVVGTEMIACRIGNWCSFLALGVVVAVLVVVVVLVLVGVVVLFLAIVVVPDHGAQVGLGISNGVAKAFNTEAFGTSSASSGSHG